MKPVLHPNGFVQLALNEESTLKLHVWPAEPLTDQAADYTIHDHVWDLASAVLLGELHHVVHDVEFSLARPNNPSAWRLWEVTDHCRNARQVAAQGGSILQPTEFYAETAWRGARMLRVRDRYTFPRRQFHTTKNIGLTATLMRKATYKNPGEPRVLCRLDHTPDDVFQATEPSEAELWDVIREAVNQMEHWAYNTVRLYLPAASVPS